MTRDEVLQHVMDITARYDKQTYALSLLRSVCDQIARVIDSHQNLREEQLQVDSNAVIHNITLNPDFLKVSYLRPLPYNILLEPITPDRAVRNGRELVNVYYRSGNTLLVRLNTLNRTSTLAFGWFARTPVLVNGGDTNWILTDYADLVIHTLAGRVFAITGDIESANEMNRVASALLEEYKNAANLAGNNHVLGYANV